MFTADLWDERADEFEPCLSPFVNYGARRTFHGPAVTLVCQDHAPVRRVLSEPGGQRVLVVEGGGAVRTALMGDNIAALAVKNDWAGVVVHGAVRDVATLGAIDLGVKALASTPCRSTTATAWQRDVPVTFGEATVYPGSMVFCDEDGVLVGKAAGEGI